MSSARREYGDALRCGDRGAAVTEIRATLAALGLLDNPDEDLTTGGHVPLELFDAELDQAVRAFQQHRGLLVDGIVGEATYRALKEASYRLGARTLYHQFGAPLYGDDVATLQARLQDLGFYTGLVDGHFGLQTHNALMSYQRESRARRRRHLWSRNVAFLVLSELARHGRLTARDSRGRTGPPVGTQAVGQADHHRSGSRRHRPRRDHAGPIGTGQRSGCVVGPGKPTRGPDDRHRHGNLPVAAGQPQPVRRGARRDGEQRRGGPDDQLALREPAQPGGQRRRVLSFRKLTRLRLHHRTQSRGLHPTRSCGPHRVTGLPDAWSDVGSVAPDPDADRAG